MSANDFGRKIFTATTGMVPFAVSIAMFPFFCEMVDRDDKASLADYLTRAARMLVLVFAPMAAGAVVLSLPVSRLLFGSMGLSSYVVWLVATANVCYVLVIPAMAVEPAVIQAFFSDRMTIAPTAIGIVMSTASMVWSWYAIAVLQLGGPAAITAVALGYTASRYLKVVCLVVVLRWTVPAFALPSTLWYLARLLVVMTATGGIAWEVRMLYESRVEVYCGSLGFAGAAVRIGPELAVAAAAGAVFFLAGCWVLRLGELGEMLSWAKQKIRRRGTGAGPGGASPAGGVE